jgi:hypothetical protein
MSEFDRKNSLANAAWSWPFFTMTLIPDRYKVLSAGIFSLVLAMGVARFAYTPLLPLMQQLKCWSLYLFYFHGIPTRILSKCIAGFFVTIIVVKG